MKCYAPANQLRLSLPAQDRVKPEGNPEANAPTVTEVGKWLRSVIEGHNRNYGVLSNLPSLGSFRYHVGRYWYRTLRRRSQKLLRWERTRRLFDRWLPCPKLYHAYPARRPGVIT